MIKLFQKHATCQKHIDHVVASDFSGISTVRYQYSISDVAGSHLCLNDIHNQNEPPQLGKLNVKLTEKLKYFQSAAKVLAFSAILLAGRGNSLPGIEWGNELLICVGFFNYYF